MKDVIDAVLARHARRWVERVVARSRAVSIATVVLTVLLGVFAGMRLGINSDNVRMLADTLPSKIAYGEFSRFFPNLDDALLIVVDGETAELARESAVALERELAKYTDRFTDVYQPGGGSFFEKNGLLYRSPDELDEFADQMARLQPVLAELERDPSIASLARIIELGLAAVRQGESGEADWSMILDRVGNATVTIFDEFPIAVSWEEVLLRGSSLDVGSRRVLVAHPILDFGDVLAAGRSMTVIRETAERLDLSEARGITVRITGNPALNYEEMIGLAWDIGGAGVFCFAIVCGVLYLALRSWKLMLAAVATLLMGLVFTAAFAAATVVQLNLLSLAFGVLFIGLGVDFAIHLGTQYIDLLRSGHDVEEALGEAAAKVGSSLIICTLTTSIGFFVFLPSDYRGVAELGLITGCGMFIILALTLTTLPALLAGWLRIDTSTSVPEPVRFHGHWLESVPHHARTVLVVALLFGAAALALLVRPGVSFDSNIIRMRNPETESVQAFNDLMAMTATTPWYANLVSTNLAGAEKLALQLRQSELIEQAITISDYVPDEQEEKLEILMDVAMLLETPPVAGGGSALGASPSVAEQIEALEDLREFLAEGWVEQSDSPLADSMRLLQARLTTYLERIKAEGDAEETLASLQRVMLSKLPGQIGRLREAVSAQPISQSDLPEKLTLRMLAPTGEARVQIFPREDLLDPAALARFVEAVREVDIMASGVSVNLYDFGRATVSSFRQALILAVLLILILLWFIWRTLEDVLLALTPMVLSGLLTVGAMALLDIQFNFANVIVLPLLFGVGVDSGIHLVHRSRVRDVGDQLLATTTARAVFYSAITTIVSFGTLAFSSHRGVASLGVLLTIGMFLTMICNLVVLPALLEWRRPHHLQFLEPSDEPADNQEAAP
jgi:hopanoid biosynthesis associated RND transporter like protein HpnN